MQYYGGCVYGKTLHGSGNYSANMAPFSRTDTGFVSAFYMYSDDDDYYDHDEIDFGELDISIALITDFQNDFSHPCSLTFGKIFI